MTEKRDAEEAAAMVRAAIEKHKRTMAEKKLDVASYPLRTRELLALVRKRKETLGY